jgi:hypothetical protein
MQSNPRMSRRFIFYSLVCLAFAMQLVRASDSVADAMIPVNVNATASTFLPASAPGRSMMFYSGLVAMAFTYRRAWLNWKTTRKS